MKTFLWVILGLFCLEVLGKTLMLYQRYEKRSMAHTAGDLIIAVVFLAWAVYLLATN